MPVEENEVESSWRLKRKTEFLTNLHAKFYRDSRIGKSLTSKRKRNFPTRTNRAFDEQWVSERLSQSIRKIASGIQKSC